MAKQKAEFTDSILISYGSCSFGRIYNDGSVMLSISQSHDLTDYVYQSCLPRTALLLFAISLEALANRVIKDMDDLGAAHELRERDTSTTEKWKLIPKCHPAGDGRSFNTSGKTWQAFVELVSWRNEYVHPKAIVPQVQMGKRTSEGFWTGSSVLKPSEIPVSIRRQFAILNAPRIRGVSGLPTSPYDVNIENALRAREIVDKMVKKLDELLSGRLTSERFLEEHDHAKAIHPGGVIQDIQVTRGLGLPDDVRRSI